MKRRGVKALFGGIILIFMMLGVSGCMRGPSKVDRMMKYISEKYPNDTFEFKDYSGGHLGSKVTKIYVSSEKVPNKGIRVICTEVDGEEIYKDTYLNYKFEEQTREHLLAELTKEFGDNIFFKYNPNELACTENGSEYTTFEEYIAEASSGIDFSLAVCCDDISKEEAQIMLGKVLWDTAYDAYVFFLPEGNVLSGEQGKENAMKQIENRKYLYRALVRKQSNDNKVEIISWTEGV